MFFIENKFPHSKMHTPLLSFAATVNGPASFETARQDVLARGGARVIRDELRDGGFVADDKLTTGTKPLNVFARIGAGVMEQPGMLVETRKLQDDRFVIASNRPENDKHWDSDDPEWVGRASMAKRHRFLILRDLTWKYFNVLTFGMRDDTDTTTDTEEKELLSAIKLLDDMEVAVHRFVAASPDWSQDPVKIGMYFHCYGRCSVNSCHLHIIDESVLGPTFHTCSNRNLSLNDARCVLKKEFVQHVAARHGFEFPLNIG